MDLGYVQSEKSCQRLFSKRHRKLYYLSKSFRSEERHALYALFAFYQFVYAEIEESKTPGELRAHFDDCESIVERVTKTERHKFKVFFEPGLERACLRFQIPKKLLTHGVQGAVMKTHFRSPLSPAEYWSMAYHQTGVWASIVSLILGYDFPLQAAAIELSQTLWAVNHLNDPYLPPQWTKQSAAKEMAQRIQNVKLKKCLISPLPVRLMTLIAIRFAEKRLLKIAGEKIENRRIFNS